MVERGGYIKIKRVDIMKIQIEFNISSKIPQNINFIQLIDGKEFQNAKIISDKIINDKKRDIEVHLKIFLFSKVLKEK